MGIPGLVELSFKKVFDSFLDSQNKQLCSDSCLIDKIEAIPSDAIISIRRSLLNSPHKAQKNLTELTNNLLASMKEEWKCKLLDVLSFLVTSFKNECYQEFYNENNGHLGKEEQKKEFIKDQKVKDENRTYYNSDIFLHTAKKVQNNDDAHNPADSCGHLNKDSLEIDTCDDLDKDGLETDSCGDLDKDGLETDSCGHLDKGGLVDPTILCSQIDIDECTTETGETNSVETVIYTRRFLLSNKPFWRMRCSNLAPRQKACELNNHCNEEAGWANIFLSLFKKSEQASGFGNVSKDKRKQNDHFVTVFYLHLGTGASLFTRKVPEKPAPLKHMHCSLPQKLLEGEHRIQKLGNKITLNKNHILKKSRNQEKLKRIKALKATLAHYVLNCNSLTTPITDKNDTEIEGKVRECSGKKNCINKIKLLTGKDKTQIVKYDDVSKINDKGSMRGFMRSIKLKRLKSEPDVIRDMTYFVPCKELTSAVVNIVHPVNGIPWNVFEKETMRHASFATYPLTAVIPADRLASSGFVYIGDGRNDKVKCYFCLAEKEGWQERDDIDHIHKLLRPTCPMVMVQFTNNAVSATASPGSRDLTQFSSAMLCSSQALASGPAAEGSRETNSGSTHRNPQGINQQAYDEVDHHSSQTNEQQRAPMRREPPSNSLLAENHRNQNVTPVPNQQNSGHPVINSQIYSIPPASRNTVTSDTTSTATLDTSSQSSQSDPPLSYQLLGIFHERPKYAEYAVLSRRLLSFEDWPSNHFISKEDLAKAGLFFAGYGDCCKCFFCGGGLRNWEMEDHPLVEHARWFGKCGFIRQYMGQEFVDAVKHLNGQLNEDCQTITLKNVSDYMQEKGQNPQSFSSERTIRDDAAVRSIIDVGGYDAENVISAATALRESGETLSADLLLRKILENRSGASAAASIAVTPTTGAESTNDEDRLTALKEQNDALRKNLVCKICMDKEVRIVFLPCGHLVSCQDCAIALNDCPVCRQHIRARARANIH